MVEYLSCMNDLMYPCLSQFPMPYKVTIKLLQHTYENSCWRRTRKGLRRKHSPTMRTCRTFNPAAGMKKQESIISLPHGGTDSYADVLFFSCHSPTLDAAVCHSSVGIIVLTQSKAKTKSWIRNTENEGTNHVVDVLKWKIAKQKKKSTLSKWKEVGGLLIPFWKSNGGRNIVSPIRSCLLLPLISLKFFPPLRPWHS